MATMVEKLQLVVDATTSGSEAQFQRLTARAKETGDASVRTASTVATAADRVAKAQLHQADEAGKLRVAQQRLHELQAKGNASASQLAAAEEKVSAAQRRLHLATRETVASTAAQTKVQAEAESQAEDTGQAQQDLAGGMDELKGKVAGLVAGGALVGFLKSSTEGFLEGARGAATLATSMNATTEQAGTLSTLLTNVGLDAADVLEIQAEFAQKIAANGDALSEFGASVQKNADGTTNWATTLEDALVNLQKIPDATERNRRGFALFGEEGYKQLSRLLNSGMAVEDALAAIGTPFSDEDVAATREYDQAMMRLSLTSGELGRTVGRTLVPILSGLVDGFGDVAGVLTAIPLPIALATAAAVAMGAGLGVPTAMGARLTAVMATVRAEVGLAAATMIEGGAAGGVLGAGLATAGAAGRTALGLIGGPIGAGLIATGGAFYYAQQGAEDFAASVEKGLPKLEELRRQGVPVAQSIRQVARELQLEAGFWENRTAAIKGVQGAVADLEGSGGMAGFLADTGALATGLGITAGATGDADLATVGYEEALRAAAKEAGAFAQQQADSQLAVKGLADMIAEGKTSGEDFATAVQAAASAQERQANTSGLAEAAVAAYNATTRDAVSVTRGLIDAQLALEDANYGYLDALDALKAAKDDEKTSVDEVAQAHTRYKEAALEAADSAADAAVEAARQAGTILTPLAEAQTRAGAMVADLRTKLNAPGLSEGAKKDLQELITKLEDAAKKGDIKALLTLTGADDVAGKLDTTTKDRDTTIQVESRGGPAVKTYLDGISKAQRLAIVRTESRGGPAVAAYLQGLAARQRLAIIRTESRGGPAVVSYLQGVTSRPRLAIIRTESRGGPAVDSYLTGVASRGRLAIIRVETRGGPAVDSYLDGLASQRRVAVIQVQRNGSGAPSSPTGAPRLYGAPTVAGGSYGAVNVAQLVVQLQADGAGRVSQQTLATAGRQVAQQLSAYTRQNGNGWLKGLTR